MMTLERSEQTARRGLENLDAAVVAPNHDVVMIELERGDHTRLGSGIGDECVTARDPIAVNHKPSLEISLVRQSRCWPTLVLKIGPYAR